MRVVVEANGFGSNRLTFAELQEKRASVDCTLTCSMTITVAVVAELTANSENLDGATLPDFGLDAGPVSDIRQTLSSR